MFYNVLKVKDLVDFKDDKIMDKNELMTHNNNALWAIALKKDEIIDTHTSLEDAAVCVFEGEIEIHFTAEKFNVDKGEMIMFKKDDEHKVVALKDSKFFVIKI